MTEPLNSAGRTEDEERLVGWIYYLEIAINQLAKAEEVIQLLVKHHYRDPRDVLREIKAAMEQERWSKYPMKGSQ